MSRRLIEASSSDDIFRETVNRQFFDYWRDELADHLQKEERLLTPVIQGADMLERLIREHQELAEAVTRLREQPDNGELTLLVGKLISHHIRWEERCLFPEIERSISPSQLRDLAEQTDELERLRSGSIWSPRRGELVKRRQNNQVCTPDSLDGNHEVNIPNT